MLRLFPLCLLAMLAATPTKAGTLYKSISPSGVVQFSDIPPDGNAVVLEQRAIGESGRMSQVADGSPVVDLQDEGALERANAQVDLAEHSLALARRSMWSELEGLRLSGSPRASSSDVERVEFYKRNVVLARQNLMELLRLRTASR
jgi:hypothetical protein